MPNKPTARLTRLLDALEAELLAMPEAELLAAIKEMGLPPWAAARALRWLVDSGHDPSPAEGAQRIGLPPAEWQRLLPPHLRDG
jgi:hypothetical protein